MAFHILKRRSQVLNVTRLEAANQRTVVTSRLILSRSSHHWPFTRALESGWPDLAGYDLPEQRKRTISVVIDFISGDDVSGRRDTTE